MENIKNYIKSLENAGMKPGADATAQREKKAAGVYAGSLESARGATFFLARAGEEKVLVCWGDTNAASNFKGEDQGGLKIMPCDIQNASALQEVFPFTKPVAVANNNVTFGTGDRLGLATPAHIQAVRDYQAIPVLAQQSIRELTLTNRTYPGVVADASWGVFQEHFTLGYGADGDHLKTPEEIGKSLQEGATMITLDCSEYIDLEISRLSPDEMIERYSVLDEAERSAYEKRYLNKEHEVKAADGTIHKIGFSPQKLAEAVLTYRGAIRFSVEIFEKFIKGQPVDFEMSVDETETPTDPTAHFFVATELLEAGVHFTSLAPRFTGEFQKGIDYIGDHAKFEQEFIIHAALADHFGYKLSIHSGSDKFSVFPVIGKYTQCRLHHKTAGTSWLEAVRLLAAAAPKFFREMYAFAKANFSEATKYYHVGTNPDELPGIEKMEDSELPKLLDHPGHRQLLHITYGLILCAGDGKKFKQDIYRLLNEHEEQHYEFVRKHIGRHLAELGVPKA